jgi:alanyl-tRNA synthetase
MVSRHTSETSSRSSRSDDGGGSNLQAVRAHSAVHVLSGAITAVLGPQPVKEVEVGKVIIIASDAAALAPRRISEIEAAANRKIGEDVDFFGV